jgi:DNA repair protein RecO (recombination protein O)
MFSVICQGEVCGKIKVMPRLKKSEGLIIARRSQGEADRLVMLFSKNDGLLPIVAKGVRRVPSRRGGLIEPFSEVVAVIQGRQGRYFLSGVEAVNYYLPLRNARQALARAGLVSRLLQAVLPLEESQPVLYERLKKFWQVLPRVGEKSQGLLEMGMIWEVLRVAGLKPQLKKCTACGQTQPGEAVILDAREHGWHCLTCHGNWTGTNYSVPPEAVGVWQLLVTDPRQVFRLTLAESLIQAMVSATRLYISGVAEKSFILNK